MWRGALQLLLMLAMQPNLPATSCTAGLADAATTLYMWQSALLTDCRTTAKAWMGMSQDILVRHICTGPGVLGVTYKWRICIDCKAVLPTKRQV